MPTSMFSEIERVPNGTGSIEEQRALQLAFELSMIGIDNGNCASNQGNVAPGNGDIELSMLGLEGKNGVTGDKDPGNHPPRNTTQCVPVPSSEHVAEIVGRQGCKIKALRAKTNTYIKTPVRGEEPVFVVTGRKEDVARAKREILSAAEHFSQIRASRKSSLGALLGAPPGPPASVPGHVTISVRVPYRVVGLVVGPKGATIKRIQHQTHTYIVTPSREKEPVFEVTGMPENTQSARQEIEAHIAIRTGSGPSMEEIDLLGALCRGNIGDFQTIQDLGQLLNGLNPTGSNGSNSSSGAFSSSGSCSSSSSSSGAPGVNDIVSIWTSGLERDEGLGDSPSFDTQAPSASNIWSFPGVALPSRPSPPASTSPVSPTDSLLGGVNNKRECMICGEKEITCALVPCGHNHFCIDCGNRICKSPESNCPMCGQTVIQALRIFN